MKTSLFSTFQKPQTTWAVRNTPKVQRIKSVYLTIHRTTRKYSEMLRNTQKTYPNFPYLTKTHNPYAYLYIFNIPEATDYMRCQKYTRISENQGSVYHHPQNYSEIVRNSHKYSEICYNFPKFTQTNEHH